MNIDFFTKCLSFIAMVFQEFPPLLWLLCCAIICSIAYIIKDIIRLK